MSAKLQPLSGLDALFLHLESPEMPMHVGGLHLFELPLGYHGDFYEDAKRHIGTRLHLAPAFTRKLVGMPFDLANPVWVEDADIDLDYHVRRIVLSKPGTMAQLQAYVGRLHSSLLDRSRPLWEIYVIEGLASGQVGMYGKIHHAAVDGSAGAALAAAIMDLSPIGRAVPAAEPRATEEPTVRELLEAAGESTVEQWRKLGALVPQLAQLGGRAARDAVNDAVARLRAQPVQVAAKLPLKRGKGEVQVSAAPSRGLLDSLRLAPATPLNRSITNQRSFAAVSLPLPLVKASAKVLDATINDLVMAICAGALRAWLLKHASVPREPLVAAVPFSLRAAGDTQQNNQVSMMLAELATQEADPLERLAAVKASMARGKRVTGGLKAIIPTDFPSVGAPWFISGLAALYARSRVADRMRPIANVVISNVMGPQVPLYMSGAQMTHYWPLSVCVHGIALNITVQSYNGLLEFGLTACRKTLPKVDELARLIEAAAAEYGELATRRAAPLSLPAAPVAAAPPPVAPKPARRRAPGRKPQGSAGAERGAAKKAPRQSTPSGSKAGTKGAAKVGAKAGARSSRRAAA